MHRISTHLVVTFASYNYDTRLATAVNLLRNSTSGIELANKNIQRELS